MKTWDTDRWNAEMLTKTSIALYRECKTCIQEDKIYANTTASQVLFQARTNTLPLNSRNRHSNEDTTCQLCNNEEENLEHFILRCPELSEERGQIKSLQQPYIEEESKVIIDFLFDDSSIMEVKKGHLYRLWQSRKKRLMI